MKNIFGVLLAGLAFGQPVVEPVLDQVYRIAHLQSDSGMHEIAATIGSITDIKTISVDTAQKTLVVHATPTQMAMARWLLHWLDQPLGWQAEPAELQASASDQNDVLRVLYLHHVGTDKDFQELLTAIRSLGVSHKLFSVNASRAVAVRGTRSEVETVTWLANQLDRSAEQPPGRQPVNPEYRLEGRPGEELRVFYLTQPQSRKDLQEIATLLRTITEAPYMFTYSPPGAILLRGTRSQIGLVEWLSREFDQPKRSAADLAAPHEYHFRPESAGLVRVFYLPQSLTIADFQQLVQRVRNITGSPTCFTYNAPRAFAMRGTAQQVSMAAEFLKQ